MLKFRVIIEKDEDGVLVAKVPDLPGCATEGKTREEFTKNVKEAIQAYLKALKNTAIQFLLKRCKSVSKLVSVNFD
jgi:predicted RNase H-like HicB family nuclease